MKNRLSVFIVISMLFLVRPLVASEAGSSHYVPGTMASFIDTPTGVPFNVLNLTNGYFGDASVSRQFPIAGLLTADLSADYVANAFAFQYDAPVEVLHGKYAFTISLPVVDLQVNAGVAGPSGGTVARRDSRSGLGDLYFSPIILYWQKGNFKYLGSVGIYAPSGAFDVGRLANIGKNYWTFSPVAAMQYSNPKNGLEATVFTGFNFNTKNNATNYQSGQEFYLDFTVDKRFKNGFGVGATGNIFQQITGDSGSGAKLGGFKGRTFGMGPEVSYMGPLSKSIMFAMELKWLPEIEVQNRTQGSNIWFKFGFVFN